MMDEATRLLKSLAFAILMLNGVLALMYAAICDDEELKRAWKTAATGWLVAALVVLI